MRYCAYYVKGNAQCRVPGDSSLHIKDNIVSAAADFLYSSARYYCLDIEYGITSTDPTYAEWVIDKTQCQQKCAALFMAYDNSEEKTEEKMDVPAQTKNL